MRFLHTILLFALPFFVGAQLSWRSVDTAFGSLPPSVHVYFTDSKIDTAPFRAYYVIAELKDKRLHFTTDTTHKRRLSPSQFYEKNNEPLVVVNGTFFSFETNANLNVVIKNGKLVSYNIHTVTGRGKDTLTYRHPFGSAIGISKRRQADVAWLYSDSTLKRPYAATESFPAIKDSNNIINYNWLKRNTDIILGHSGGAKSSFQKWKMQTAIGGGPVLIQKGEVKITNNEELKFVGKAINDKHPRTAMGYTKDGKLIILAVEGRNPSASGATLVQLAQILKDLGCIEALNLDGGGSTCLLVNGKETITPSDGKQRAVPAVFIISEKSKPMQ